MNTLTRPLHEKHLALLTHIEELRKMGDRIEEGEISSPTRKMIADTYHFLVHELIPHTQAEDKVIYPAIQLILVSDQAIAALTRDHAEIASLTQQLGVIQTEIALNTLSVDQANELRCIYYGLYTLIKIHYSKEEEIYLPLLDSRMQPDEALEMFEAFDKAEYEAKIEKETMTI